MLNPSPLVNANAVLLDEFLFELRTHLTTSVSWLDLALGSAQALKGVKDGRTITYPGVPSTQGEEYINCFPDEHLGNFLWFDIPSQNVEDNGRPDKRYFVPAGMVVWGDLRRMYTADWRGRTAEDAKNDILTAFNAPGFRQGKVRVQRIYDRQADIYRGYTDTEVQNQYMMRPYIAFRMDLELTYQPGIAC